MTLVQGCTLFLAALLGGALNAVAGGGSFLCFPALILSGAPSAAANMTSTVALWPASLSSVSAYHTEIRGKRKEFLPVLAASLLGGIIGAVVLVHLPGSTFEKFVPFLMLFATLVFSLGRPLMQRFRQQVAASGVKPGTSGIVAWFIQLLIAVYGGFFGGGIGMLMLALLTLQGMESIHQMNALKNLLSACINGVAILIFVGVGGILWPQAAVMMLGGLLGGYAGASYARRINPAWIRLIVSICGFGITALFFARAFSAGGI